MELAGKCGLSKQILGFWIIVKTAKTYHIHREIKNPYPITKTNIWFRNSMTFHDHFHFLGFPVSVGILFSVVIWELLTDSETKCSVNVALTLDGLNEKG